MNSRRLLQNLYEALCPPGAAVSEAEALSTPLDKSIFSVLLKRCAAMFQEVLGAAQSWWFPVHLCDVFQKHDPFVMASLADLVPEAGRQADAEPETDENARAPSKKSRADADYAVRTAVLVDYGEALLRSADFWNIAPDYLVGCGAEFPLRVLDDCLSSVQLGPVRKTEWFYALALKFALPRSKERICRDMVTK